MSITLNYYLNQVYEPTIENLVTQTSGLPIDLWANSSFFHESIYPGLLQVLDSTSTTQQAQSSGNLLKEISNAKEDFGYAIWHICDKSSPTTNWNAEIIELMVKRGADINHVCEGKTPLDFYINDKPQQCKSTENDKKIKILRNLGGLTKEELDNQNK